MYGVLGDVQRGGAVGGVARGRGGRSGGSGGAWRVRGPSAVPRIAPPGRRASPPPPLPRGHRRPPLCLQLLRAARARPRRDQMNTRYLWRPLEKFKYATYEVLNYLRLRTFVNSRGAGRMRGIVLNGV